jgi:pseudouridine kinase
MHEDGHVLVIGAAGLDIKGSPNATLQFHADNPGKVWNNLGGVGRNIAENLARLEVDTVFLTAVGNDASGDLVLAQAAAAGVNVKHVLQIDGVRTGSFVTILDEDGQMAVAINDYDAITHHLTHEFLMESDDLFAAARLVAMDLNLSPAAIKGVVEIAEKHDVPICVDPTSSVRAPVILPYLDKLHLITPNAQETKTLCKVDVPETALDTAVYVAKNFTEMGVDIAVVKVGAQGMIYADGTEGGHIEARKTRITDRTGAGDALFAVVLFGMVNGLSLDESLRLGAIAASLTLQSSESVLPDLTPDLLYSQL